MTINDRFIPVLCLVVGLVLGFGAGKFLSNKKADGELANVKARLTELRLISPSETPMKLLTGSIKSIDGNALTITLRTPKDPFDDPLFDERVVTIDDKTKITVESTKDRAAYEKETANWKKKLKLLSSLPPQEASAKIPPSPPKMTVKKDGTAASLEVGKTIVIRTAENVKMEKSFVALSINILNLTMAFGPTPPSAASSPVITPSPKSP